ncbi:MAG: hypothetical protein DI556_17710 [Rhodovulum sulfidophilum]|uniref:Uncharacterized protein n=1 Tax=Rhodovulum sulfidophilum TaxID=35806 RepID=A0A2W5N4M1_RHOSU|nr:MAG: hypothetical protein DI556_17710 [Rhodovulum sulfidophilum]
MTESRTFANPLTAEGREKMRENWRTGRETMKRYPGAGASNLVTMMFWLVVIVGFRPEMDGDLRVQILFTTAVIVAVLPLGIVLSALLAEAAHVSFGTARTVALFGAAMVASVGIGVVRTSVPLGSAGKAIVAATFLGFFTWTATLICASYLRQGRATPSPEPVENDALARGQVSLAMGGSLAAFFALTAILLAVWIAL